MKKLNHNFIAILVMGALVGFASGCNKDDDDTPADPLKIQTVTIPAGTFTMGSPATEINREDDETQFSVTLSAFIMSKYEVTNAQFAAFLNAKGIGNDGIYTAGAYPGQPLIYVVPDTSKNFSLYYTYYKWNPKAGYENYPVVNVTWYGAAEFATYKGGTLPTEAQWEYACRAATTTPFNTGNCLYFQEANYNWAVPYHICTNTITSYPGKTQAVGTYPSNSLGLFDMHGNVSEWCSDNYGTYPSAPQIDPTGPAQGGSRVIRGGFYGSSAVYCRSAYRFRNDPSMPMYGTGFRLVFPK